MADEKELEYPRMVYHKTKGHTVVKDGANHKAHLGAGWQDEAIVPVTADETEDDRVAELEAKVEELAGRVAALEAKKK